MRARAIDGTESDIPVPIALDVLVALSLPLITSGPLMQLLMHDEGMPTWIGFERERPGVVTEHAIAFDLGVYGPMAERAGIEGRMPMTYEQGFRHVFVNPDELPA